MQLMRVFVFQLFLIGGLTGCSTLNESFQLGALTGLAAGAVASYSGHKGAGGEPSLKNVAAGAGIGLAAGLIASYYMHRSLEQNRSAFEKGETEMHFGDLPPNPFLIPNNHKKGNH